MFCGFECLATSIQSQQQSHATAEANLTLPKGQQAEMKLSAQVSAKSGRASADANIKVHTSGPGQETCEATATAATEKDKTYKKDQLEIDLEKILEEDLKNPNTSADGFKAPRVAAEQPEAEPVEVDVGKASQPIKTALLPALPEADQGAKAPEAEKEEKLLNLSNVTQDMLRRPGTIDIDRVLAEANGLTGDAVPSQNTRAPEPKQNASSLPAQNTGAPEPKQNASSLPAQNTGAPEPKQNASSLPAQNTGAPEPKQNASPVPAQNTGAPAPKQNASPLPAQNTGAPEPKQNAGPLPAQNTGAPEPMENESPAPSNTRKSQETDQQRLQREAHNSYMRFYRSLRSQA